MNDKSIQASFEQLKLMLASATATMQLLQQQLASATVLAEGLRTGSPLSADTELSKEKRARDTSRWKLDGRFYSKGRFLLEIFKKYVDKKMSLEEVNSLFNPKKVFEGSSVPGNRTLYQAVRDVKDPTRFHTDQEISTKDGEKLVVSNQFGIDNFPFVLRYVARQFNIPLEMEGEHPYSSFWKSKIEIS